MPDHPTTDPDTSGKSPLISTIRWTRMRHDRLPAYGHTVALWLPSLGLVVRGYRDAVIDAPTFIHAGSKVPLVTSLIAAWAELPTYVLPPPDGGAA